MKMNNDLFVLFLFFFLVPYMHVLEKLLLLHVSPSPFFLLHDGTKLLFFIMFVLFFFSFMFVLIVDGRKIVVGVLAEKKISQTVDLGEIEFSLIKKSRDSVLFWTESDSVFDQEKKKTDSVTHCGWGFFFGWEGRGNYKFIEKFLI